MPASHAFQGFPQIGAGGCTGAGGFQAKEAAVGCRDSDGAATIGGVGDGHHASRHGGSGPATGATRAAAEIPGVAGRTVQYRFCGSAQAELRRIGLAQDDQAGGAVTLHQGTIMTGHETAKEPTTVGQGNTGAGEKEILQQVRHAGERALGKTPADGVCRFVIHLVHHRVDGVVVLFDPLHGGFQDFFGGYLTAPHQPGETQSVVFLVFFECCHFSQTSNDSFISRSASRMHRILRNADFSTTTKSRFVGSRRGLAGLYSVTRKILNKTIENFLICHFERSEKSSGLKNSKCTRSLPPVEMTYSSRYRKNKNPERTSAPAKTHPASVLARSADMSSMRWNFGSGFAGLGMMHQVFLRFFMFSRAARNAFWVSSPDHPAASSSNSSQPNVASNVATSVRLAARVRRMARAGSFTIR